MSIITIIGAGMMGSTMSIPASDNGHKIRIVGTPLDREIIDCLRKTGIHPKHNRKLPDGMELYQIEDIEKAIAGSDVIVGGVSSFGVEWFIEKVIPLIPEQIPLLSVTKGLQDIETGELIPYPREIARRLPLGRKLSLNAIGGPCTSYELADRNNTEVVFCGDNHDTLKMLKNLFETDYYHISTSVDVEGVECAVAMKNAYALGISLAIGLNERTRGEGCVEAYNPQAALFGQSVREISRIIKLLGGGDENIIYAAGDLYVTVFGGRTRKIGTLLGRGLSYSEAKAVLKGETLESVNIATNTARALRVLAKAGKIDINDFPLLMHVDEIINQGAAVNIPWKKFESEKK